MSVEIAPAATDTTRPRLLCVDDEANILNALKRLFRPQGYEILTATSGAEGLALLDQREVDLVISDMRMPQMDGTQFLEQVCQRWPATIRILLTGFADVSSIIAIINRGEIYRYICKPWVDSEVLLVVRQALDLCQLAREKARLEELTRSQNLELQALNAGLENVVAQRTAALQEAMQSLELAHDKLKKSFIASITVFANLIELRHGSRAGNSRRVADLARRIAQQLQLTGAELQDITVAALLRDIGKLALPDRIIDKPFENLGPEERQLLMTHPIRGQGALMALEQLTDAARLIRSQHERFDGVGYPDGLSGPQIARGARILAAAGDYVDLQQGRIGSLSLSASRAYEFVTAGRGKRYDPEVVDAFVAVLGPATERPAPMLERKIVLEQLESGMVLSRDLLTRDGMLLLAAEHSLQPRVIAHLRAYARSGAGLGDIHVRIKKAN